MAYALGNLYRSEFVMPKSQVACVFLAAFYLQFAELRIKLVSQHFTQFVASKGEAV